MMELTTTLNDIRKHSPCCEGWETLLASLNKTKADDEALTLPSILESNGVKDAIRALCAVDAKYDHAIRLFACFCARYSLDIFEREFPDDKRPRQAIETAERYILGQATREEMAAAWAAAGAAWDAAWAAEAAEAAGAAWDAAWKHFENEFIRLCRLEGEHGEVVAERPAMADETSARIEEIKERCDKATQGPWNYFYKPKYNEHHVNLPEGGESTMKLALFPEGCPTGEHDAKFIAKAREDLPFLLSLAEERRAEIERLERGIDKIASALAERPGGCPPGPCPADSSECPGSANCWRLWVERKVSDE